MRIEWQLEHHFWIVTFISMLRIASYIFGDMRKEGLVSVTVIIVGRILYWGIFHAVVLRVAKSLCTSSRIW